MSRTEDDDAYNNKSEQRIKSRCDHRLHYSPTCSCPISDVNGGWHVQYSTTIYISNTPYDGGEYTGSFERYSSVDDSYTIREAHSSEACSTEKPAMI